MSLWDTDKNSSNRSKPSLNHNDQLLQKKANGTTSLNPVTDSSSSSAGNAGFGTLRVIWQTTDTITVTKGGGAITKIYTHNLGQIPLVFAVGTQQYTIGSPITNYIAGINNDINGGFSLAFYNDSLNSFTVGYDDLAPSGATTDTVYVMTFKAALFT